MRGRKRQRKKLMHGTRRSRRKIAFRVSRTVRYTAIDRWPLGTVLCLRCPVEWVVMKFSKVTDED